MPQYDVDLRDYWRIIRKRKLTIIFMVVMVGLSSYGFAKMKEPAPRYEATASVKIEGAASMLSGFGRAGFFGANENILTQAFIIRSFPVLVHTAKRIGWLPKDISHREIRENKSYLSVITRLKAMTRTEIEAGTNIINIIVTSGKNEEAAFLANSIANAFRDFNIKERNRQTLDAQAFIETQLNIIWKRLTQAEERLKNFQETHALTALNARTSNIVNQIAAAETAYERIQTQKKELASVLEKLRNASDRPETIKGALFFLFDNRPLQDMSAKLKNLERKRETLLIDFTEKHPDVVDVNDQIKMLITDMENEVKSLIKNLAKRENAILEKLERLRQENRHIPEKALQLARLEREVKLQESLYQQLKARHQEIQIQVSGRIEEVTIVRPALVPTVPTNRQSAMMIVGTGIVLGLIIGLVLSFVMETLDTSIGTIEDVEALIGVSVQGLIPFLDIKEGDRKDAGPSGTDRSYYLVTHYDPKSLSAESFRALRANLQFIKRDRNETVFVITSSFIQEGKTFVAVNTSLSMAQSGEKVLLIEADLRKPVIHKVFGLSISPGLTDIVLGNYQWKEAINTITDVMLGELDIDEILRTPGLDNLHIMTAGTIPPNPSEILRSAVFYEFLKEAKKQYDFVFLDVPPILPVVDATEIAPHVDGVLLVYKVGQIGRGVLKRAKATLDNIEAKVTGVILNNVRPEIGPDYFKYHTQYYYGRDRKESIERKPFYVKILQKVSKTFKKYSRYYPMLALALSAFLLILGIFWKEFF
ncbi:MAG: AAA family ATPase [Deltaproteobacteria bacterium]|nr:AAA family ATPase [Deltaproteobacteria bacterium]MBW1993938.1 AAA family ATPase [Deltaproteobacteria bacterium]